jgi:hypothetical protein
MKMKKFLSAALVFVVLLTFIAPTPPPPPRIIITNNEELKEFRMIAEAEEHEFSELIRGIDFDSRDFKYEHLIRMLEFYDSFYPYICNPEIQFRRIDYSWQTRTFLQLHFETDIGERYEFHSVNKINNNKDEDFLFKINFNQESYIDIYSYMDSQVFNWNGRRAIGFRMDMGDYIAIVHYTHRDNEHIQTVTPEEIVMNLFGVEPWIDEPEPEPLTTADALAILRHVAGIELLPTEDSEITTADALRILRIVAGL